MSSRWIRVRQSCWGGVPAGVAVWCHSLRKPKATVKIWLKTKSPYQGAGGRDGGRHRAVLLDASCITGPIPVGRLQGLGGTTFLGHGDLFIDVSDDMLIYIVVGVVCTVLALLVAAILYLIRTKQIKGKGA